MTTLAEPNLTALSGQEARFLAGPGFGESFLIGEALLFSQTAGFTRLTPTLSAQPAAEKALTCCASPSESRTTGAPLLSRR